MRESLEVSFLQELVDTPLRTCQFRDIEFHGKFDFTHDLGLFLNVGSPVKSDHVCWVARTTLVSQNETPSLMSAALTNGQVRRQSSDT